MGGIGNFPSQIEGTFEPPTGEGKGTSLNSASLTPKPLASSVYVHVPEAPSPLKRSMLVMSLFPFRENVACQSRRMSSPATTAQSSQP